MMTDVTIEDATANVYPEAVPRAPDGSPEAETEMPIEQAQAIGAMDLESAAKNKRNAGVIVRKTNGEPRVSFGTKDALEMFDQVRQVFGTSLNSINIVVVRVRPEPMEQYLPVPMASMTSSTDLYKYVAACHGHRPNAQYKVIFRDGTTGNERGSAYLHMPDKSPGFEPSPPPQPPQYAPQPQFPPGWGQPGGSSGPQGMGYYPQPPPAPLAPQAPPVVHVHPQAQQPQDTSAAMGAMGQMGEMQKFFAEQSQRQSEQMMVMMRELMTAMRAPPPPAGFIPLPDNFPLQNVPAGYLKIPGGMIPAPPPPMPPPGYQAVPIPAASPAPAAAVPVYQPIPQAPQGFNSGALVNQYRDMMKGVSEIQKIADMFQPRESVAAEAAAEVAAEAANPVHMTKIGDIDVAYGQDGKLQYVPTLMGAVPKLVEVAKSALTEYQKVQQKQHDFNQATVRQRIELANAVQRAQQGAVQPAALQPGAPPIHVRQAPVGVAEPPQYFEPEPIPAPPPVVAAPEPAPEAPRKPRPTVGIPTF